MSTATREALAALADGLSAASAALAHAHERVEALLEPDPVQGLDYLAEDTCDCFGQVMTRAEVKAALDEAFTPEAVQP